MSSKAALPGSENHSVVSHPQPGIEFFERVLSCARTADGQLVACTAYEKGETGGIAVFWADERTGLTERIAMPATYPAVGQPAVAAAQTEVALVWIEADQDAGWRLMHTILTNRRPGPRRCLWTSPSLLMAPALCRYDGLWTVAFTAMSPDQHLSVCYAAILPGGPIEPVWLVSSGEDANRPAIASNGTCLMLAWDTMTEDRSSIDYLIWSAVGQPGARQTICRADERYLSPFLAADRDGFVLSWVISSDVIEPERGIVDHRTMAGCARVTEKSCILMPASTGEDPAAAADLRPGLLGYRRYSGYYGLRRRPRPVVCADGVCLVWEAMLEPAVLHEPDAVASTASSGQLIAQKWTGGGWSQPRMVHQGGSHYALPGSSPTTEIPIIYLDLLSDPAGPVCRTAQVNPDSGVLQKLVADPWAAWQPYKPAAAAQTRYTTTVGGTTYQLFWADTHTHSVFSPDAEGEPDELIRFGRHVAHLDAMAIVDNDFYPYFGLTRLKWQIHLALAERFTQGGAFACFPGYEYTYHDAGLQPDFNHRYVIYPRGRGGLFRRTDPASGTLDGLMQALEGSDALPVAHHTTWRLSASDRDRQVEVCSSWRVCKEESDQIERRLALGDRFSFIGSSDTHRNVPGLGGALTGIYATALTPEAIFDAYRNHRVIATQGNRTVIDLSVAGLFIGQSGAARGDLPVRLQVLAERRIESVTLLRDGQAVRTFEPEAQQLEVRFLDPRPEPGEHVYYVRVKLAGDPSFNAPDGVMDPARVFFSDDRARYPHNFARADGPFAWSTPIWLQTD